MSKQADTAVIKWQHDCKTKDGKKIIRQIIDTGMCRICGWEHKE